MLALVGDSTNAVREGRSPSETEVAAVLAGIVKSVARPRGGDDVCLERRPGQGGGGCRAGRRARSRGDRPGDGAGRAGRARDRLSRRRAGVPRRQPLWPLSAGQGAGALHRQPGRAARGAGAHCRRRSSAGDAEQGRPGDLLVAHHPRQREGGRQHHQRPGRPGHRGHHRPHPSGACLRPSAPRRAARHDLLGEAADPDPGAWRGAASGRARAISRARPACRR